MKNNKKISLESLYTPYTLDCNNTFTFDSTIEGEIENYNQENDTNYNYDDFDFDFEIEEYLKELAINRLNLLKENILDDVIINIVKDSDPISPKYYNYTTDKSFNTFIVNNKKLNEYIEKNKKDYNKNKIDSCNGFMWFGNKRQTKLAYYLDNKSIEDYDKENYLWDQFDNVCQYEYISFKLLNNK